MFQTLNDSVIRWDLFNNEDIFSKFKPNEWSLIVSDIYSQQEWQNFINDYCDLVCCYVMRTCRDNREIAFVYLYNEVGIFEIVSIHGGGWDKSLCSSLYYYRGLILIIKELISQNIKVRTSCFENNYRAYKFLRSVGFVRYNTSNGMIYMWINKRRLQSSKIYKRFFGADF